MRAPALCVDQRVVSDHKKYISRHFLNTSQENTVGHSRLHKIYKIDLLHVATGQNFEKKDTAVLCNTQSAADRRLQFQQNSKICDRPSTLGQFCLFCSASPLPQ